MRNTINPDLSSHWVDEENNREVFLPSYNPSTLQVWQSAEEVEQYIIANFNTEFFWSAYKTPEERQAEQEAVETVGVRAKRNQLLAESDWTQVADVPLSAEKKAEWTQYRQALRDVTAQQGFPMQVQWPTKP